MQAGKLALTVINDCYQSDLASLCFWLAASLSSQRSPFAGHDREWRAQIWPAVHDFHH